jgi:hypothetical protein
MQQADAKKQIVAARPSAIAVSDGARQNQASCET